MGEAEVARAAGRFGEKRGSLAAERFGDDAGCKVEMPARQMTNANAVLAGRGFNGLLVRSRRVRAVAHEHAPRREAGGGSGIRRKACAQPVRPVACNAKHERHSPDFGRKAYYNIVGPPYRYRDDVRQMTNVKMPAIVHDGETYMGSAISVAFFAHYKQLFITRRNI